MAKQSGIHQLRGKVGNMKYYGMKGVDGGLVQSINEGMSDRVKNGAEYENTRRNNFEFGMSASTAGAIIKGLSSRWRYILRPFATGMLVKNINTLAKTDDSNTWGNRTAPIAPLQSMLPFMMQNLAKNDITDFSALSLSITSEDEVPTLTLVGSALHNAKAEAAGCSGVIAQFVWSGIEPALGGRETGAILNASTQVEVIGENDYQFGAAVDTEHTLSHTADTPLHLASVVLLPYRSIGSEKVIMQEFASVIFAA